MEEKQKQFVCTGDCIKCEPIQRQYCSAQFTYNTMRMVEDLVVTVADLKTKVEAIQGNEALLFDPTHPIVEEKAQEGDGAIQ